MKLGLKRVVQKFGSDQVHADFSEWWIISTMRFGPSKLKPNPLPR